jgi:HSP20 family molecular chaperone IbpA
VVGILTYSEQKLINKIKKLLSEKQKGFKYLYIIHNLITYTSIEQVENYIKEYLLQSTTFTLAEGHNISTKTESENGKYFYEKNTSSKIYHMIYANEGSEAGNNYNKFTLKFLERSFQDITDLESFDVIKTIKNRFIDLSNEIFEKFDNNLTLNDFDKDNKSIKLINHNNLTLKKCFIDELGFSNLKSSGFEPKYNYYKKGDKLTIKIESPGNIGNVTASMHENEGYNKIIIINGEKKKKKSLKIRKIIYIIQENMENILYNALLNMMIIIF